MPQRMTPDHAKTMALKVLAFLANSEGALLCLMDQSGLDVGTLKARAGDADMQVSLLDFLLSDEELLTAFCDAESVDSKAIHMARYVLDSAYE